MASTQQWIEAFRLRTLPLALSSIALASFIAYDNDEFDPIVFVLCITTTLFLQVLSNLANDFGDRVSGADDARLDRGGISDQEMKRGMMVCGVLAFLSGVSLILVGTSRLSWHYPVGFLALGGLAIWAAVRYTVGSNPYGYSGLGDLFVLLFFGFTGVLGTYFLHTGKLHIELVLPALSVGLLSVAVLNLNNMRDRVSDEKVNKRTMAVILGKSGSRVYHFILIILAFLSAGIYMSLHWESAIQLLFLIPLPLLLSNLKKVLSYTDPGELDSELKKVALSTLIFSITFGIGLII